MSLFSLCLDYVASNIHLVDSFIGFPDTIGKKIFEESTRKGQFTNIKKSHISKSNLKVFFDAYTKTGILDSLCLQYCHLFVNDALIECPWLLKELTCLDLSFCSLGDNHELLSQIALLQSLEVLNLQANCLTDSGIRQLTTPLRFYGKKHGLKFIDISSNEITAKSLRFLKSFNKLCVMIVSDTSISEQFNSFEFGSYLSPHNTCLCCDDLCHVTTDGWAKEILDSWKQEYYENCSSSQSSSVISSHSFSDGKSLSMDTKAFYKKRKPLSDVHYSHCDAKKTATNKLILVTKHFHCPWNLHETNSDQSEHRLDPTHSSVSSLTMTVRSAHHKEKTCFPYQRQSLNNSNDPSLKVLTDNGDDQLKRKGMTKTTISHQFYKKAKLNAANYIESNSGSGDVLKLYTVKDSSDSEEDLKPEIGKKTKSLIAELQDWT